MHLGIYPNEFKIYVHRKTCTHALVASLSTIAKLLFGTKNT